jgi:hypothetical protein
MDRVYQAWADFDHQTLTLGAIAQQFIAVGMAPTEAKSLVQASPTNPWAFLTEIIRQAWPPQPKNAFEEHFAGAKSPKTLFLKLNYLNQYIIA